jgi:SHS2 domain-containing protein
MSQPDSLRYEVLEHTADVGIVAYGRDLPEVFAAAATGLSSLMVNLDTVQEQLSRRLTLAAPAPGDYEGLLVDWLSELVYVFDAEHVLFRRYEVEAVTAQGLRATAWGEPVNVARHILGTAIKAVTYHALEVRQLDDGTWQARVILDV